MNYNDCPSPLDQLVRWVRKGYGVTLVNEYGNGWICTISNVGPLTEPMERSGAMARIRAQSSICDTPEEAIEDLLKLVQP